MGELGDGEIVTSYFGPDPLISLPYDIYAMYHCYGDGRRYECTNSYIMT